MTAPISEQPSAAISVKNLSFSYGGPQILSDLTLELPYGSRCLLVGCNGVGKSSLLRILAGKRMVKVPVSVLGRDAYTQTQSATAYLGPEWANNPTVRTDVSVSALLSSMSADEHADRRDRLLQLLDIDVNWHMHQVSDGERRRVQIMLGLLRPFRCLLLDEVTVDLDVVVRKNLLQFLKNDCNTAPEGQLSGDDTLTTIVYATHIFDGLGDWPTHIAHMNQGTIVKVYTYDELKQSAPEFQPAKPGDDVQLWRQLNSPLLAVVERWLRGDFDGAKKRSKLVSSGETTWDRLSENSRVHGDKYYNYWN
eukprot:Partr_v1_DN27811_c1_g1_i1_m23135 putative (ABC) transporter